MVTVPILSGLVTPPCSRLTRRKPLLCRSSLRRMASARPGRTTLWWMPIAKKVGGHLPTKSAQFFLRASWKPNEARIELMPRMYQS